MTETEYSFAPPLQFLPTARRIARSIHNFFPFSAASSASSMLDPMLVVLDCSNAEKLVERKVPPHQ
jgi:hypothetical protein